MKLNLHPFYCNHAILQAGKIIRISGEGEGKICVKIADRQVETIAKEGKWEAELLPMEYGGPYEITVTDGQETITLSDVYLGDVFLVAGQSNVQFKVCQGVLPEEGYLTYERIRHFTLERIEKDEEFERHHPEHGWVKYTPEASPYFSSLGYYFAIEYQKRTGRAVGMVSCYQGASVIQSWMPQESLTRLHFDYPAEVLSPNHTIPAYQAWNGYGQLYDFMFRKIIPYTFSHVLWYQGEGNISIIEGENYASLLTEMIRVWRADLRDETLPFIVVQIADFDDENNDAWHLIQKAQIVVGETVPYTQTVISKDVCETNDLHPPTKRPLAKRICDAVIKGVSK